MGKSGSLGSEMQKLIDNAEGVLKYATKTLKNKMDEDFKKVAKQSVDKYYEYKNGPYTKHGRRYNLYKIYNVTTTVSKKEGSTKITTLLLMESDPLEGVYKSNSSYHQGNGPWKSYDGAYGPGLDYGGVEADYVFENFIHGRHPWTNGWSPIWGVDYSHLKKGYKHDKVSPNKFLDKYAESYGKKYIDKYMQDIMIKFMM